MSCTSAHAFVLGILLIAAAPARADSRSLANLAQARADAAAVVFARTEKSMEAGAATVEQTCTWSERWYQAQHDQPLKGAALAAAADANVARLKAIETLVTARVQAGASSEADAEIVTYFRAEAELFAAQVRGK